MDRLPPCGSAHQQLGQGRVVGSVGAARGVLPMTPALLPDREEHDEEGARIIWPSGIAGRRPRGAREETSVHAAMTNKEG